MNEQTDLGFYYIINIIQNHRTKDEFDKNKYIIKHSLTKHPYKSTNKNSYLNRFIIDEISNWSQIM